MILKNKLVRPKNQGMNNKSANVKKCVSQLMRVRFYIIFTFLSVDTQNRGNRRPAASDTFGIMKVANVSLAGRCGGTRIPGLVFK
jgi:hypothetical protein